jgi:hypothetical protein
VSPVRYELGFCIPEDFILHSHRREDLKAYMYCRLFNRFDSLHVCGSGTLYQLSHEGRLSDVTGSYNTVAWTLSNLYATV